RDEAEATVVKDIDGAYVDRYSNSLTKKGIAKLSDEQMNNLFKNLRLRISLCPNCDLACLFCSNEGSCYASKKDSAPDLTKILKLGDMLIKNTKLRQIDFSGGEPLLHPDFLEEKYELIKWTKKHPDVRFSLHTNGTNLSPKIIDKIKDNFSRIGISLHSVNFDNWNKITNPTEKIDKELQKEKFKKLIRNLEYLSAQDIGEKVFLKAVIIKGINDSEEELKSFLEFCKKLNFHPKFLQFDPQYASQKKLQVGRKELFTTLQKIGVEFDKNTPFHNDPKTYLPGVNFSYSSAPLGLHSIFGCGDFAACKSCYNYLCMFVKFSKDGSRVYLKPCSILDTQIDITHAIEKNNTSQLFDLFKLSREYLMLAPGLGACGWNKEAECENGF
ncbi:radical SAM protein, partial [Candidatus Pacearchaeota archaeon]|nr:radical SAM protein [Candidatus Pacearchaeota archaeon]